MNFMNSSSPEILLITRPLTPPWDEASKNLAYTIAKNITEYKFHILVGKYDSTLPKHITQHLIYKGADWTGIQKTRLILSLPKILKNNPGISIAHLLFAPTPLNTRVLGTILKRFEVQIIQNLACPPQNKKTNLNFADKIIVYSKYTAERINQKNVNIIPPFIDFEKFPVLSEKARSDLRKKWRIGENDKIILFPGEYSRLNALGTLWKGYTGLISNFQFPTLPTGRQVSKKFSSSNDKINLKLFMACRIKNKRDLVLEKKFKKLVNLSQFKDNVWFLGKIEKPEEMYQIADLTVFPVKKMEGKFDFPFVLLESLACGTPVLTSAIGALSEIWRGEKEYGEKYVFEKEEEFVRKAGEILEGEKKKDDLSNFVKEKFSKDKILRNYKEIYDLGNIFYSSTKKNLKSNLPL